ncbi:oxidoreductase [Mycobacteroides chelonae]|uniref:flavin reductase family protein n=1 Tax=Mycobacteroides chelonae TaxID=1774 RepID=UPI0007A0FC82|nr:flavin reductase family protein [Mycobacteroides chelonae]AMW20011.1 flavin reductase like domain protein [Mycobacterium sp. QIA-37]PKQ55986.1 oxidoreductase [Mycobacterium sp. MHSD3]SKN73763.1 FMN reductase (NADH) NtaB [Mycobacteroides abscessus subsp. bolletii]MBF9521529.1 flavin reductase family protein [Mycobacteroides chelonae]OHT81828.1 oxidoreductase [Mycobacteroides chelonae]
MESTASSDSDMQSDFTKLMGQLDHPMYLVTVQGIDGPSGCLVGFATQISMNPPLFLVGLSEQNHTWRVSQAASHLTVHVIPQVEGELVRLFGEETGDNVDKFARCSWRLGPHGAAILDQSSAWFVGEILARIKLGDHVGHVLSPVAIMGPDELHGYVAFSDVTGLIPGHEA